MGWVHVLDHGRSPVLRYVSGLGLLLLSSNTVYHEVAAFNVFSKTHLCHDGLQLVRLILRPVDGEVGLERWTIGIDARTWY